MSWQKKHLAQKWIGSPSSDWRRVRWLLSWLFSIFQTGVSRSLTVLSEASRARRLRATGALILALASCSCAGRPLQGVLIPAAESAEGGSRIPVLVGTTRQKY